MHIANKRLTSLAGRRPGIARIAALALGKAKSIAICVVSKHGKIPLDPGTSSNL